MSANERVTEAVMDCEGAAWDGCHRIFILMDKEQVESRLDLGYGTRSDFELGDSRIVTATHGMKRSAILAIVKAWWEQSCELRFIMALDSADPTIEEEVGNIIAQGEEWGAS